MMSVMRPPGARKLRLLYLMLIPRKDRHTMRVWLQGKKEIIAATVSGLALTLAGLGIAPELVPLLENVATAARSGEAAGTVTALASFVGGVLLLLRATRRAAINRAPVGGGGLSPKMPDPGVPRMPGRARDAA